MILRSTKSYWKLPVAHMQWFDEDGCGPCAKWHGYDRSVHFEFSGLADEHGWIVGFGDLKPLKQFLEYYFDHTAIVGADDPRMEKCIQADADGLVDLRVLPYGVSMEMSSIFIWEQVNPFIHSITGGRAYVSRVECREHDSNSAFIEVDQPLGYSQGCTAESHLVMKPIWPFTPPKTILSAYRR